jgi:hypothetical protein
MAKIVFIVIRVEEKSATININNKFSIVGVADEFSQSFSKFCFVAKSTVRSVVVLVLKWHKSVHNNINPSCISSSDTGTGKRCANFNFKSKGIENMDVGKLSSGIENVMERNRIASNPVKLFVGKTKRNSCNFIIDTHSEK